MSSEPGAPPSAGENANTGSSARILAVSWIAVGIPMLWGVWMTLKKAALLFR